MNQFIKEKVCFYSSMYKGRSSSWEIIRCAAKMGVAGIELMNFSDELCTADMFVARELGKFAKEHSLALPCFSVGTKLAGPEKAKNLDLLKKYADICSELEIPYLHHTVYCDFEETSISPETFEKYFEEGVESSLIINDYAKRLGVKTLVEDQGYIVNGVKNYRRYMELTDWRIGTVLDFGNIFFANETPEDFCDAFADNVRHVHVKDFKYSVDIPEGMSGYKTDDGRYILNVEFGHGDVNFDALKTRLEKMNYNGYYALEYADCSGDDEVLRTLDFVTEKLS